MHTDYYIADPAIKVVRVAISLASGKCVFVADPAAIVVRVDIKQAVEKCV